MTKWPGFSFREFLLLTYNRRLPGKNFRARRSKLHRVAGKPGKATPTSSVVPTYASVFLYISQMWRVAQIQGRPNTLAAPPTSSAVQKRTSDFLHICQMWRELLLFCCNRQSIWQAAQDTRTGPAPAKHLASRSRHLQDKYRRSSCYHLRCPD
ncbi:hypothetical protein ACER0C_028275 [Sarotherodon galilaeus]